MNYVLEQFFNIAVLQQVWPIMRSGISLTLGLSAVALPVALLLGLVLASIQQMGIKSLRIVTVAYIDVIRSIPPLVLLTFVFYGLPFLGLRLGPFSAAVLALVINSSSYAAEIFRAGLKSVNAGQMEAARSTGLSWIEAMVFVILPQAVRNVMPDLVSNTIELVKLTSIASAVALQEILRSAMMAQNMTYNATPLVAAALIYFLALWPFVRLASRMHNKQSA